MWFFNKKEKIFLEDFSLNLFNKLFSNRSENKITDKFHKLVKLNNSNVYISDDELNSIYLEIYSLIIYLNYKLDLCMRLEDSLRDYLLNVKSDSYLYDYTLNDYNKALSDQIPTMYTKNEAIILIDQRFQLFKAFIGKRKLLGGYYNETVVARTLNRMGSTKNYVDLYLTTFTKQLFINIDYENYTTQEQDSVFKGLKTIYNDIITELKNTKLY